MKQVGTVARAGALASLLVGGCSLLVESDKQQCARNEQCLAIFGGDVAYSCVDATCVRPSCTSTDDCRARGVGYAASICGPDLACASPECISTAGCSGGVCDLMAGRCIAASQAGCTDDAACTRFEGVPICAGGTCVAMQCQSVADCQSDSPTMMCIGGKCDDPVWGCIGQPDRRAPATMPTATLRVPVYNAVTRLPVDSLTARACPLPQFDATCATPLPGSKASYESTRGILTITGLPQDAPIRLKIDFPADSGLLGLDLYSQRPPRDITDGPLMITVPGASMPGLTASFDPPLSVDLGKSQMLANVFDCRDMPAGGVTFSLSAADMLADTVVLYAGRDMLPTQGAQKTDPIGTAFIVNAKVARFTVSTSLGSTPITEYPITAFPQRLTTIMFYPWLYR